MTSRLWYSSFYIQAQTCEVLMLWASSLIRRDSTEAGWDQDVAWLFTEAACLCRALWSYQVQFRREPAATYGQTSCFRQQLLGAEFAPAMLDRAQLAASNASAA